MSDDRFAIKLSGSGTKESPYLLDSAYELEDDGELEFEDDFFKRQLTIEGDPSGTLKIMARESSYNGSVEVKTYKQIGTTEINGVEFVVMIRESEYVLGGYDDRYDYGSSVDDDYRGGAKSEDVYYGFSGSDRVDCKGVYGRKAGLYFDTVTGGDDLDAYVIGGNPKSCYYDDKKVNKRDTFLYCDDFEFGDKFEFRNKLKLSVRRYELVDVAGSQYETQLVSAGLVGVDKVLINKKDSRDMLACINFDDSSFPPSSGWSVSDVLG